MPVLKDDENPGEQIKEGLSRKSVYLENIMTTVFDLGDGPWSEPGPLHSHVHEQTSYVVEGEIMFFCEGESAQHLKSGDMYYIPSGKAHGIQLLTPKARLVDNFSPIRKDFLNK